MRSVRTIVLGAAVAACALGALSAPAFAKEPITFGKFVASATGTTKGHGEVSEMRLGPYRFTGKNLGNGSFGPVCEKELKSKGEVTAGEHETFEQKVTFSKCFSTRKAGTSEEAVSFHFTLDMVFHSNRSAELGGEGTEVEITKTSTVKVKGSKSSCELLIPAQTVPVKAATKPEDEFEAVSYGTEEEAVEGKGKIAKFGPIRDRLDIEEMVFKKIKVIEQLNPEKGCTNEKLEEGATFNKELDQVEYHNGLLEAELEEISLNDGNISFVEA
jgi:hypothetical protein